MKIDQCLFGYDDGHRLLASSFPLGAETSLLTELSDLAPGTVFGRSEGYWTGLPAPSIGRYVLMRTWPAPEMPRPGCVWTHALLIKPNYLESIADLSRLQTLVIQPANSKDRDRYREPMEVDFSHNKWTSPLVNDAIVRKLIESLYEMTSTTVEVTSPGELDGPIFAVWSQQWPRLRRNFRFQTAASRDPRSTGSTRFDVTVVLVQQEKESSRQESAAPSWLSAAVLDVHKVTDGTLRSFLWTYGRDVRRQRGSFRPLVEIHELDHDVRLGSAQRVIDIVKYAFPTLDDAVYLKQNLVDGVLVSHAQAEFIRSVVLNEVGGSAVFPPPTVAGIARLTLLWPKQPDQILQLIEIIADTEEPIGKLIFEAVINIVRTPEFWSLTRSYPNVRKIMVQIRPEFLTTSAMQLDDTTLIELLPFVPANTACLTKLIAHLMSRDNETLANVVFDHFSEVVATQIVSDVNDRRAGTTDIWLQGLIHRPKLLLKADVIGLVSRTSLLYELANALGWLSPLVTATGVSPWNTAFLNASNDLREAQADTLGCFLVALAFTSGDDSGLHVIERFYDNLHGKILKSGLPQRGQEILSSRLPVLGWMWSWDLGLRFRLAVAEAYVRYEWPPQSYALLAHDRKGRALLADAASDISGGHAYFKAVSQ